MFPFRFANKKFENSERLLSKKKDVKFQILVLILDSTSCSNRTRNRRPKRRSTRARWWRWWRRPTAASITVLDCSGNTYLQSLATVAAFFDGTAVVVVCECALFALHRILLVSIHRTPQLSVLFLLFLLVSFHYQRAICHIGHHKSDEEGDGDAERE